MYIIYEQFNYWINVPSIKSPPDLLISSSQMSRVVWTAWNTSISNSFKILSFTLSSMFKEWFRAIEVASTSMPTSTSFRDEFSHMKVLQLTKLGEGTWVMVWEPAKSTTLLNNSRIAEWVCPSTVDGVAEVWAEPGMQKKNVGVVHHQWKAATPYGPQSPAGAYPHYQIENL